MDHVEILRKSRISKGDNLLGDILAGTKTIESRWYVNKIDPWDKVKAGDVVYLKESGCPVTAVADVLEVRQYDTLDSETINQIIKDYGRQIAPHTSEEQFSSWAKKEDKKRYCILVFLKNPRKVSPFNINKKGYGISSAWMCVGDISRVMGD